MMEICWSMNVMRKNEIENGRGKRKKLEEKERRVGNDENILICDGIDGGWGDRKNQLVNVGWKQFCG